MFQPGRRAFSIGSIVLVLTAIAHTLGNLPAPPSTPQEATLLETMKGFILDMGLMKPSMLDVFRALNMTMSVTVLFWGVQNLVLAKLGNAALMRPLALCSFLANLALVALYWIYPVPPALISFGLAALLFGLALLPERNA